MSSRDTYLHCDKVIAVLLVSLVLVYFLWFQAMLDGRLLAI